MASLAAGFYVLGGLPALAAGSEVITGPICKAGPTLPGCANSAQNLEAKNGYLNSLLDAFIYVAVIVATIFIFVGGIKYLTSTGDPGRIASAKNTLQYAIIGLIVAIIARGIIGFVIKSFNP